MHKSYNEFKNKVVLVTGGTSGIGLAVTQMFSEYGAKVIVAAIHTPIQELSDNVLFLKTNVSNENDIRKLFNIIEEKYRHLDYAINSAGILGEKNDLEHYSLDGWNKIVQTNLTGVFLSMKYEMTIMKKSNTDAVIINLASAAGLRGKLDLPGYSATKHAVLGLTKSAVDVNSKIRVHALCPPGVKTPMRFEYTGMYDGIEPVEVADAILWLCSDSTKNLNGEILLRDDWITKMAITKP